MYNLRELSAITDVPVTTITYWIKMGLVPRARYPAWTRKRNYCFYDQEHIQRIRHITEIREQNMTLDDIRDRLNPPEDGSE